MIWKIKSGLMIWVASNPNTKLPFKKKSLFGESVWFLSSSNTITDFKMLAAHTERREKKKKNHRLKDLFASPPSSGHIWKCSMFESKWCLEYHMRTNNSLIVECKLTVILLFKDMKAYNHDLLHIYTFKRKV